VEAIGWALIAEAGACVLKDPVRAGALLEEFETLVDLGESARQAGHQLRARLAYMENDFERATALYEHLIDEDRRSGNVSSEGHSTWMLANIEYKVGRPERAVELGRVARDLIERTKDVWLISMVNRSLAGFLVASDAYAEAERTAWDALALYAEIDPSSTHVGTLVEILAFVAATRGAYDRAATLLGFASAAAARPGAVVYRSSTLAVRERLERCLADAIAAGALRERELAALRERGARLRAEDAIALAMG
jgi:tetratricopeptide (TPR) repeat protein